VLMKHDHSCLCGHLQASKHVVILFAGSLFETLPDAACLPVSACSSDPAETYFHALRILSPCDAFGASRTLTRTPSSSGDAYCLVKPAMLGCQCMHSTVLHTVSSHQNVCAVPSVPFKKPFMPDGTCSVV
jgi:hypothetical protein